MRDEHLVEALARSRHDEAAATQQRLARTCSGSSRACAQSTSRSLCLAGGLFFNTYFTTSLRDLGFRADLRAGAPGTERCGGRSRDTGCLAVAGGSRERRRERQRFAERGDWRANRLAVSPAELSAISRSSRHSKTANSFDLLDAARLFDVVLHALSRGRLVG